MRSHVHHLLLAATALVALATPASAQRRTGLVADLMQDVRGVQAKLDALAKAMPADKYDWRPAPGVRSVREVFLHVSSENYLLPSFVGFAPPAESRIDPATLATVDAFEKQSLAPDATVAAIDRSFANLLRAMSETPDSRLDEHVKFFGQDMTVRQTWVATATHMHEHLGQAIAYARMNGVTPPWSK